MCVYSELNKVGKKAAKIRNRYNQVPHLAQDIIWESDKTQENIRYKRAKSLDHKSTMTRQESMTNTKHK